MTDEERKVSELGINLGVLLLRNGKSFLKNNLKTDPRNPITKANFSTWISENIFKGNSLWDEKFYFEGIDFWNTIKRIWWGTKKDDPYTTDTHDCEDFAGAFKSEMSRIFGLNSVGRASGNVYKNGKLLERHSFNIIVADGMKSLLFEPMDGTMIEWTGQKTVLGNWAYEIDWIEF